MTNSKNIARVVKHLWVITLLVMLVGCSDTKDKPLLNNKQLAEEYYKEDAQWYLDNIPFFECSDKQIEQVYYYRWKLYKAHIRNTGDNSYVITEFINHVPWDRDPYCTINAASMHHLYEGRWLKDPRYMDGYINYLYQQGGNDRRYSESIADASYARYLVDADPAFITAQLDSMKAIYERWADHWDSTKNLYYIPAMPDATEYTIASIDASGGKDGFDDGEAFRPTINSYMYGNAIAILNIAELKGDEATSKEYTQKAIALKNNIRQSLWNDSLQHFTDRFKVNNQYVHYWDFIRGRELAGFIPWCYFIPPDSPTFNSAWKHIKDTTGLLGKFGFRTNEPSYEYYFKQFVFFEGQRGSQWNGPSWPYQTSQAITAMANLVNNYTQDVITKQDYFKLLKLYAQQHFLPDGRINLVENYDPNLGGPIVYYYWSNHYNHSSFNNLVITGLCGLRPSESDTLDINPLIDDAIQYFCINDVIYHGHKLTIVYDKDGKKYNAGKGISVFIDGKQTSLIEQGDRFRVVVGKPVVITSNKLPVNNALNIARKGFPVPTASVNSVPDSLYQAIDGGCWYFTEIRNRWNTSGSASNDDWFALDLGKPKEISTAKIYIYNDDNTFGVPDTITISYESGNGQWTMAKITDQTPSKLVGNTVNTIIFDKITASRIRINFIHTKKQVAVSEIEFY